MVKKKGIRKMLIDMHAHSSGISTCCQQPADKIIEIAQNIGIDGIILTNHYHKPYVKDNDALGFAKKYVDEYRFAKECGDKLGFKVFFGAEVTMDKHSNVHLLVYGIDEDFVLKYPDMFDYTQEELYRIVKNYVGSMIQAHPMRKGKNVLLDLDYLDGVEVNSHQIYDATHLVKLSEIARERGYIITSGGDFHADAPRAMCGAYLPDDIVGKDIGKYLLKTEKIEIRYQEPRENISHKAVYDRQRGLIG